jgi:glucose-1-phosphate thymidylyltransferase
MWGIIPAAGSGTRIQPLAFSKELLPVGSREDDGVDRPRAISEYLIDRMVAAGATKICFVISPNKTDIMQYFDARVGDAELMYVVQSKPSGLCDAIFRPLSFIAPSENVLFGLPDTVWFPENALTHLPDDQLSFALFPVEHPELFDAVRIDSHGRILEIQSKQPDATSHWIWGAFKMPGWILSELHDLWLERQRQDVYLGPLINAYLAAGGKASAFKTGRSYVDVGTLNGYRAAIRLLSGEATIENSLPGFMEEETLQTDVASSNGLSIGRLG